MRIHNKITNTSVEGPGKRYAIWTQGCDIICPGCFNVKAQEINAGEIISPNTLAIEIAHAAEKHNITGVTIAGGEPLLQPDELDALLTLINLTMPRLDIMLYTGHKLADIKENERLYNICRKASLLISEPFILSESPDNLRAWVGSKNQILTLFDMKFRDRYFPWPKANKNLEIIIGQDLDYVIIGNAYKGDSL